MTWTGVGFVQSSWRQALSPEHMQNAAKVGPHSLGPSSTVMSHSGGLETGQGPRIWIRMVRSRWKVDREGSAVGLGGLAALQTLGQAPRPVFCACLIGNF